ncbi:unnamed protein product, partial [Ectocarpus sp. 8 AP-2014]
MVWLVRSHQARHEGLLGLEGRRGGALPRRRLRDSIGHDVCTCRPISRHSRFCSPYFTSVVVCVSLSAFGSVPLSGLASERQTPPRQPARATAPLAGKAAEALARMTPHTRYTHRVFCVVVDFF